MDIKPTTSCPTFDLYDLGPSRVGESDVCRYGFRGENLGLPQAQTLARESRQRGWATVVVPSDYSRANLSLVDARPIALDTLTRHKRMRSDQQFGNVDEGADEGGWWFFVADNLTAQAAGKIPGIYFIRVDKLLKRSLTPE